MRYEIEKTRLSDHASGAGRITFHHFEGSDLDEVVTRFVETDHAQLVSDVVTFGAEAVVTAKKGEDLFIIRLYPSAADDGASSKARLQFGIS